MAEEKPKPTIEQIKWFKEVKLEIDLLEGHIKFEKERQHLLDFSTSQLCLQKHADQTIVLATLEALKSEEERGKDNVPTLTNFLKMWQQVIDLSGICPQCSGTGHHQIDFGQSRSPLNQPKPVCNQCWGSGWADTKNPFIEVIQKTSKKLVKNPRGKKK